MNITALKSRPKTYNVVSGRSDTVPKLTVITLDLTLPSLSESLPDLHDVHPTLVDVIVELNTYRDVTPNMDRFPRNWETTLQCILA